MCTYADMTSIDPLLWVRTLMGNSRIDVLSLPRKDLSVQSQSFTLATTRHRRLSSTSPKVLPKHTLEAVLLGLSRPASEAEGSHEGEGRRGECAWTELTMPVVTAALNLKPPLSDVAIGTIVRRVEISSEAPELQVSGVPSSLLPLTFVALCLRG